MSFSESEMTNARRKRSIPPGNGAQEVDSPTANAGGANVAVRRAQLTFTVFLPLPNLRKLINDKKRDSWKLFLRLSLKNPLSVDSFWFSLSDRQIFFSMQTSILTVLKKGSYVDCVIKHSRTYYVVYTI